MSDVKPPFFILGCVRSGTTLLRDVLRLHPDLICPEETHFFRWGDPFGTPRYDHPYIKNAPIRKQREMDGISDYEARICLKLSWDRKELANGYAHLYAQKIGRQGARWFDKTPQNVYGILLISSLFPDAKFIHIHRNPLNVVTSLLQGKVMPVHPLKGAINYWTESMRILTEYTAAWPERVLHVPYERFTREPTSELQRICRFLGEDAGQIVLPEDWIHPEKNRYTEVLTREEMALVIEKCEPFWSRFGYRMDAGEANGS